MSEPIVKLQEGKIRGVVGENYDGETIYKFLGVPYAKPPADELRFKPPQPVEPWDGIKDATKDGDACFHRDIMDDPTKILGGENCLVLNVVTKTIVETEELKPVMVYVHGGGFTMGCNRSDVYGAEFLLMEDIVFVCINYRLGIFGFLSLEDETLNIPGNIGLKDQVCALEWVQRNIKVFGGDPNNITIFGESAGGASVHLLVLSSLAKGLFHKAIVQSGVALCPWSLTSSNGSLLADALGKKGASDKEVYDTLKNMSGKELFEFQEKVPDPMLFGTQRPFAPVVEKSNPTAFITKSPIDIITSGEYNQVPLHFGYTSHEGILLEFISKVVPGFRDHYTYQTAVPWFMDADNDQRDKFVEITSNFYSKLKDPLDKDMLEMDAVMLSQIVAAAINHTKTSKYPVYMYRITADEKRNWMKQTQGLQEFEGVAHADELGYLFNIKTLEKLEKNTLEYELVQRFVKLWTNFARFGNPTPNSDLGVSLPPIKEANKISVLDIGKELTVLKDLPERDRIDLWKKIYSLSEKTANYL